MEISMGCNGCDAKNANDFGDTFNFYTKTESGETVSLRHLCDECAREMATLMIIWSNHIGNILLRKNQEMQPNSCESCGHIGQLADFEIQGSYDLKCPNCEHIRKVTPIG
jgi:predicted Zn-ribbon and HTH transcriptional regulator